MLWAKLGLIETRNSAFTVWMKVMFYTLFPLRKPK